MERFSKVATALLNEVLDQPIGDSDLELPPDPSLGDFAYPCFKLAKQYKKSPPQVAQEIVKQLQTKNLSHTDLSASATGAYANFTVKPSTVLNTVLKDILQGDDLGTYGKLKKNSRMKWVLEYSSPNVAKPFQSYHLRPTALGAALARVGRFRGFDVVTINHLGDWGTQYGKLAVAFSLYEKDLPKNPTIDDLVKIYVKFHEAAEKDPTLEDRAREAFLKLEKGDPQITQFWKKWVDISMAEFTRIYKRLGVEFDHIWGESHYKGLLEGLLEDLRSKGILIESEGAWVVPLTDTAGKDLPPCILQKKDGATIYATRDVAAAVYRFEKFKFDRMTYIVGAEQKLHFQQVFGVLKKIGHSWATLCEHVPTGLYRFQDSKMSTRKGNFVTLEDLLTVAKERVEQLLKQRNDKLEPSEFAQISEAVALGAVVYHDLSTDSARDVVFDVQRIVDFDGETGPYLQYAHTRCVSILRKAKESGELQEERPLYQEALLSQLQKPEEIQLVKILGRFPLHLERTLLFAKTNQLAHYLIDVVKTFNAFYRECHVLGQAPELTQARLMLVESTHRILAQGLGLLGVPLPIKM